MKRSTTLLSLVVVGTILVGRALWSRHQMQVAERQMDRARVLGDQTDREVQRIIQEALARTTQPQTAPATGPSTAASAPAMRP